MSSVLSMYEQRDNNQFDDLFREKIAFLCMFWYRFLFVTNAHWF